MKVYLVQYVDVAGKLYVEGIYRNEINAEIAKDLLIERNDIVYVYPPIEMEVIE